MVLNTAGTTGRRPGGRRHPLATVALITIGLLTTGGAYAMFTSTASAETIEVGQSAETIEEGQKLFAVTVSQPPEPQPDRVSTVSAQHRSTSR